MTEEAENQSIIDIRRAKRKEAFLVTMRKKGNIRHSCEAAGIGRSTYYRWMEEDEEFAQEVRYAMEDAGDYILGIAVERATDGLLEPVKIGSTGEIVWQRDEDGNFILDDNFEKIPFLSLNRSDDMLKFIMPHMVQGFGGAGNKVTFEGDMPASITVNYVAADGQGGKAGPDCPHNDMDGLVDTTGQKSED